MVTESPQLHEERILEQWSYQSEETKLKDFIAINLHENKPWLIHNQQNIALLQVNNLDLHNKDICNL